MRLGQRIAVLESPVQDEIPRSILVAGGVIGRILARRARPQTRAREPQPQGVMVKISRIVDDEGS